MSSRQRLTETQITALRKIADGGSHGLSLTRTNRGPYSVAYPTAEALWRLRLVRMDHLGGLSGSAVAYLTDKGRAVLQDTTDEEGA